jgi:hypothetical protein
MGIGKIASTLLLIVACVVIPCENIARGQGQASATQSVDGVTPLSQGAVQGSAPASYANACSLVEPQYSLEVNGQGPCGSTYTEVAVYSTPNVKLYVRYGQKVTVEAGQIIADYKSESDAVYKTIILSPPYQGGTYYVAIANCGSEPASFSLRFGVAVADYFGPVIKNASVKGKKLMVSGCGFDNEAVMLVNDEQQQSQYTEKHEMPTLINKRAARKISPGESVSLQVQNSNGRRSEPFTFTLPAQ